MPYIGEPGRRDALKENPWNAANAGELNYVLTEIILDYLPREPSYSDYNTIVGVLECVKQEFYRRAVSTYEETKITLNGDVSYDELPQNRKIS